MNLTTSNGLTLHVDDLTYFRFDDGTKFESFSRIVIDGLLVFTDWADMYEALPLRMTHDIVRTLDRAASELADEQQSLELSRRDDARYYFNR